MKTFIIAGLMSSVALVGAAQAQTTAPATTTEPNASGTMAPAGDAAAPAGNAMSAEPAATDATGGMEAGAMANEGGFVTYQEGTQMLASGLMGADVQGPDGESIGTVDDLLLDTDGLIQAVVVGVGGFLGIGTKDVAITNDQLEFVMAQDVAAEPAAGSAPAGDASTTAAAPAAPAGGTAATTGAMGTTGTAGTMGATGTSGMAASDGEAGWGWSGAGIDHIMVSYTREQLESAPEFEAAE